MGTKRLLVISSIILYIGCIGVPAWLHFTSISRPSISSEVLRFFSSLTGEKSRHDLRLPIDVHLHWLGSASNGYTDAAYAAKAEIRANVANFHPRLGIGRVQVHSYEVLPHCSSLPHDASLSDAAPRPSDVPCEALKALATLSPSATRGHEGACGAPSQGGAQHGTWCEQARAIDSALAAAVRAVRGSPAALGDLDVFIVPAQLLKQNVPWLEGCLAVPGVKVVGTSRSAWVVVDGEAGDEQGSESCAEDSPMQCASAMQRVGYEAASAAMALLAGGAGPAASELPISAASEVSVVLTLATQEPREVSAWELEPVAVAIWDPLAERIAPLASMKVESQVKLHISARFPPSRTVPQPPPPRNSTADAFGPTPLRTVLQREDLPFFVDSDEWNLDFGRTSTGHEPPLSPDPHFIPEKVLNLVAYVPAIATQPMVIGDADTHGFVTPAWGAVAILNDGARSDRAEAATLADTTMAEFTGLALRQFRTLLGLERDVAAGLRAPSSGGGVTFVPPGEDALALSELDALMRGRFVAIVEDTAESVVMLLKLMETLPNLEIPAVVGQKIDQAKEHTEAALSLLHEGKNAAAFAAARLARTCAEVASTHHSIVSQHSYPEQHKLALYLPLFAPLSIPLVSTLFSEVKRFFKR